jgi:hypothetical protein
MIFETNTMEVISLTGHEENVKPKRKTSGKLDQKQYQK